MKNAFILSALLLCATSVHADVKPEPIKASHIFKLTPPAIKEATPKSATILETASFPIGSKGSDVFLHLYADTPSLFPPSDVLGAEASSPYTSDELRKKIHFVNGKVALLTSGHLDLFVRRNGQLIRIQSLKFKRPEEDQDYIPPDLYINPGLDPFVFGEVYWLDTKRTKPIITLYVPGYGETEGNFVLFIFDKGIMRSPSRQDFCYWKDLYGRREVEFVSYNKSGNMQIADRFFDDDSWPDVNRSTIQYFSWSGSKFIPQNNKAPATH